MKGRSLEDLMTEVRSRGLYGQWGFCVAELASDRTLKKDDNGRVLGLHGFDLAQIASSSTPLRHRAAQKVLVATDAPPPDGPGDGAA